MKQILQIGLSLFLIGTSHLAGAENKEPAAAQTAGLDFFEAKIRPVLVAHCYKCHSVEAGKSQGNLLLDSRETIRAGGDGGPAVVPGDPDGSLLFAAISHVDPDLKMPPKTDRLPQSVLSDFKAWIQAGAIDPR